jgi:hypothetical protein
VNEDSVNASAAGVRRRVDQIEPVPFECVLGLRRVELDVDDPLADFLREYLFSEFRPL